MVIKICFYYGYSFVLGWLLNYKGKVWDIKKYVFIIFIFRLI